LVPGAAAVPPEDESSSSGAAEVSDNEEEEELVDHFDEFHFGEEIRFGEGGGDFTITIDLVTVKFFIVVLKATTIGKMKEWIEDEAGMKKEIYYLIYNDDKKKKHKLEDHYTMEDYGITEDKEFQFAPKLGGTGKRGRNDGNTSALAELRNVFGRTMKMIEDNRSSAAANMTFNAMSQLTVLMARYKTTSAHEVMNTLNDEQIGAIQGLMASTTVLTRYKGISSSIVGHIYDAIEQTNGQMKDCEKILLEGTILVLNSQYGTSNNMSWELFAKDLTQAVANRAARAGAIAGAAAAVAAAAGDADIAFEPLAGGLA
jgi:hypothetical protein